MSEPRPSVRRVVAAIARAEISRGGSAPATAIVQCIVARLHLELGKLIGAGGIDVLLARSVVLARRTHPVLAGITAKAGGKLEGMDEATGEVDALGEGALAIVAHFVELLVALIGEELAVRLLRDVWPMAAEEEKK